MQFRVHPYAQTQQHRDNFRLWVLKTTIRSAATTTARSCPSVRQTERGLWVTRSEPFPLPSSRDASFSPSSAGRYRYLAQ
jgi:hypothetical protein